jgi:hypothetical protein
MEYTSSQYIKAYKQGLMSPSHELFYDVQVLVAILDRVDELYEEIELFESQVDENGFYVSDDRILFALHSKVDNNLESACYAEHVLDLKIDALNKSDK